MFRFSLVIDAGLTVAVGAAIGGGVGWYFYGKHGIMRGCLTGSAIAFQMSLLGYVRDMTVVAKDFRTLVHMAFSYMYWNHINCYNTGVRHAGLKDGH